MHSTSLIHFFFFFLVPLSSLALTDATALSPARDLNPSPEHHPRNTLAPLDATTRVRKNALELYTAADKLADEIWGDRVEVERLAGGVANATAVERVHLSREIHARLYNLTRTVQLAAGSASRTRLAITKASPSSLAPLRIRGKTHTRLGTTTDEVADQLARVLSSSHAALRSLDPVRALLSDLESIEATAEELDWELRSMLEGAEVRLVGVSAATAVKTLHMREASPGQQDEPLSLHKVFRYLHLAGKAAGTE